MIPDLSGAVWRKSARSGGEGGNCVELANLGAIRDSKNPDKMIEADLKKFLTAVKEDKLRS